MLPIHTILHPTDFSEDPRLAFRPAWLLARECAARLVVLHVAEPPVAAIRGTAAVPPLIDEKVAGGSWEQLQRFVAQHPDLAVEHRLEIDNPADTTLRVAGAVSPDLIVMGSHGRRGLLGSGAQQVLRKAVFPVLMLKRPTPNIGGWLNASSSEETRV